MYEEKTKRKFDINWKSLIIKMVILLVAIFIIIWLISLINKKDEIKPSNISTNLQTMKEAAFEYFTGSKLPENINGKKKITLKEMFDSKLLVEFKDQNNESCDTTNSYAEATKITNSDYTIKVKLVCGTESDYIINTITEEVQQDNDVNENENNNAQEDNKNETVNNDSNNNESNNTTTTDKNNSVSNNNTSKPSTKPVVNNTTKPSTNNNTSNITHVTTNKNNSTTVTSCKYGSKDYYSKYPLAYVISGNCAVSKEVLYQATHANVVSTKGAKEYKKLVNEIDALKKKTGADIYVETPIYTEVLNKNNTGYVGFQIMFVVKQKYGYTTKVIYEYYLDQNNDRKVIIDNRSSIKVENSNNDSNNTSNNTSTTVKAKEIKINKSSLTLYEDERYNLKATITPSNTTNTDITWTSSNEKVVKVNKNGRVTAISKGTAYITATIDGVSDKVRVKVLEEEKNKYYKVVTETHYSISYTSAKNYYEWTIKLDNDNMALVEVLDAGYISTDTFYKNAWLYYQNKQISMVGSTSNGMAIPSWKTLRDHSLQFSQEFNFSLSSAYSNGDNWYMDASVNVNNLNNVTPYNNIYFTPFYFVITYLDLDDYVVIKDSEAREYEGYEKLFM